MSLERTLSIIKPDGVSRHLVGKIIERFESEGLFVAAAQMKQLSRHEAEGFYAEHKARPFFGELVQFMCSGPVLLMVLEGQNAILKNREIMGATDPSKADAGTIRKLYSLSIGENTVHGSDSEQSAQREVTWFFAQKDVFNTL
ncbi:MAG: nucleoside-diphosphate kinase [bacterium]|nr:nucleoside-diphosphate kinase [bacterium]